MNKIFIQVRIVFLLGIFCLIAGLFAHLALVDIYHGEVNLDLEWNVLRGCALVFLIFILWTMVTLGWMDSILKKNGCLNNSSP